MNHKGKNHAHGHVRNTHVRLVKNRNGTVIPERVQEKYCARCDVYMYVKVGQLFCMECSSDWD